MSELVGARAVFVVAQKHFERLGGALTSFSTLHPVAQLDGMAFDAEEFPNCGLVWWPIRSQSLQFAEPGRLVVGRLEHAFRWEPDKETSHRYQVEPESVHPLSAQEGIEIFSVAAIEVGSPGDLLQSNFPLRAGHPPSNVVLVRWQGKIVGPFILRDIKYESGLYLANLAPERDETVWLVDELVFRRTFESRMLWERTDVSIVPRSRNEAGAILRQDSFEILLGPHLSQFREVAETSWKHVSAEELVRKTAKKLLTRKQFQEFRSVLEQVSALAEAEALSAAELESIAELARNAGRRIDSLETLAKSIVDSGVLDGDLEVQRQRDLADFIEKRASVVAAEIGERVVKERAELDHLVRQVATTKEELDRQEARRLDELEVEISRIKREAEHELADREMSVALRERGVAEASRALQSVSETYQASRKEITQQILELAPFFSLTAVSRGEGHLQGEQLEPDSSVLEGGSFALPAFAHDSSRDAGPILSEEDLLRRFETLAGNAGLKFRSLDLIGLHLSVKTGDMTVVGGPSGTGKTSLVHLYAHALRGADSEKEDHFLEVSVGPGWLDFRDILGAVNPIRKDFEPSETGLFRTLCCAASEYKSRGSASGIYVVCLDEMNLAQVEHYFAPILQGLSSPSREVRCFDASSLRQASPFRPWATVPLSRALRVVGTVNFDETTRQLSDRVLDRSSLVQLRAGNPGAVQMAAVPFGDLRCEGRAVRLEDFATWTKARELPRELGEVLDKMGPFLTHLGCPISNRRYRTLCTFVGSCSGLCTEKEAFELQVIFGILPRIRNVFGPDSREAALRFRQLLDDEGLLEASSCASEALAALGVT